jgi:hypothetical protein
MGGEEWLNSKSDFNFRSFLDCACEREFFTPPIYNPPLQHMKTGWFALPQDGLTHA